MIPEKTLIYSDELKMFVFISGIWDRFEIRYSLLSIFSFNFSSSYNF